MSGPELCLHATGLSSTGVKYRVMNTDANVALAMGDYMVQLGSFASSPALGVPLIWAARLKAILSFK